MISFLRGQILEKMTNSLILLVDNIGYKLYVGDSFYSALNKGQSLEVYTYQNIKENSADLYGFESLEELAFFEMLLSVSGVGPKTALGVLSLANVRSIKESIVKGDSALLVKVSGIGKKTAERLVLELKDKLLKEGSYDLSGASSLAGDDIEALLALGYSLQEAREALNQVDPTISDISSRIKEALKNIKG